MPVSESSITYRKNIYHLFLYLYMPPTYVHQYQQQIY